MKEEGIKGAGALKALIVITIIIGIGLYIASGISG